MKVTFAAFGHHLISFFLVLIFIYLAVVGLTCWAGSLVFIAAREIFSCSM